MREFEAVSREALEDIARETEAWRPVLAIKMLAEACLYLQAQVERLEERVEFLEPRE